jgi:hypothetical protein
MTLPRGKIDNQLISEKEMIMLQDFVATNPEIEFISLPNVTDGDDI